MPNTLPIPSVRRKGRGISATPANTRTEIALRSAHLIATMSALRADIEAAQASGELTAAEATAAIAAIRRAEISVGTDRVKPYPPRSVAV